MVLDLTRTSFFCYYMNMTKKVEQKNQTQNKNVIETPTNNEGDFFAQSNIDDFLVNNNQDIKSQNSNEIDLTNQNVSNNIDEKNIILEDEQNLISDKETEETISQQKKKLDEMEQTVSKQSSKKSKITNIVFFIVNIAVVAGILIYQLMGENWVPIAGIKFDIWSLLMVIVLLALVIISETLAFGYLLKQSTGKWKLGTAYKVCAIGKYYDSVTPMATGGQPFQITYLKSRGIPLHTSLSIPLAKYVFGQIAWVIVSFICLVISWTNQSYGTFVSITSIVGFILSFVVLAATIFLSVCKTVGKKLVVKTLKLLHKMKIVKNYDKQYEKITKYISDFQDIMKQYAKSPKDFLFMTIISLLKNFLMYSMPFFIVKFFMPNLEGAMFFRLFVMSCLVDLASSFFPLPGGTGMNEISFTAAFGAVLGQNNMLVWVLILWRFCSYYFNLVQGVGILSYDMAVGNRKYKWQVVRDNLVQESEVFKREQINKFRSERAKRRKNKNKSDIREYL